MQEQDDGLDRLSGIVQRQKMIAQSIGQELGTLSSLCCADVSFLCTARQLYYCTIAELVADACGQSLCRFVS